MAEPQSATTSSSGSTRRPRVVEVNMPLWTRIMRIVFGKIRKLPQNMNTILSLFAVHLYLTMPFFFLSKISANLKALLHPFRIIHAMGFDFEDILQEKNRQLI